MLICQPGDVKELAVGAFVAAEVAPAAPDITVSFRMIDAFFAECSRQYLVSADSFDYFCAFLRDANRQLVDDIKAIVSREDLSHRDRLWLVTGRLRQHAGSPRKLN